MHKDLIGRFAGGDGIFVTYRTGRIGPGGFFARADSSRKPGRVRWGLRIGNLYIGWKNRGRSKCGCPSGWVD